MTEPQFDEEKLSLLKNVLGDLEGIVALKLPREEYLSLQRKILEKYGDKISAVKTEPAGGPLNDKKDGLSAFLEKNNFFDDGINPGTKKEDDLFRKIGDEISLEITRLSLKAGNTPKRQPPAFILPLSGARSNEPKTGFSRYWPWLVSGLTVAALAAAGFVAWRR